MRMVPLGALAGFLAAVLLVGIYWPGLHGSFFFDDGPSILQAPGVRLGALSVESLQQALMSGGAGPSGRPVAQLSFALNYYFGGFNPFAFKAINIAIHLGCGWLVFALALRLLRASFPLSRPPYLRIVAGVVALLWLLHPIQLLPVLHVVQRMTSLSALFLLAALLLHIRGREEPGRAGIAQLTLAWGVLWPLSFLSKETGVLFPLFALAWELTVRRSTRGGLDRWARVFAVVIAGVMLAGLAYVLSPPAQWLWAGYEMRGFSLVERVLTEGRVLWFYLGLIVWPRLSALGLYHDDIALSTDSFTPWTTLPAWIGLAGLFWLVWRWRKRAPLLALGVAWFLIGHALESTVLPLEIAHEHRNYLPLFGPALMAGWALLHAFGCNNKLYRNIGITLAGMALAGITIVTILRANEFGDELTRNLIQVADHPGSSRAQYDAGLALTQMPDSALPGSQIHALARRHYQLAGALDPSSKLSWLALIYLNCKAGLAPGRAELDELTRRVRDTRFAPGDQGVFYNLKEMAIAGSLCLSRADVDGLFIAVLAKPRVSPGVQAILHSWHADYLWLHERDMAAARSALGQSLKLNPGNLSNRLKWAQLLLISGEQAQARQLLLELRHENFSAEERNTINESLAAFKIK